MIGGISAGRYLEVTGGGSAHVPKSYNSNQYMTGDMRYDLDNQCIKVFDGTNWQTMVNSYATVNLNYEAQMLLDWAREKRNEELRLQELAAQHPTVADAVDAVKRAEEQVKIVAALVGTA